MRDGRRVPNPPVPGGGQGPPAGLWGRIAERLELPPDVVLNLPRVTLVGDLQLLVENHLGLVEYQPHRVRVRTARGELVITGLRLKVASLSPDELVVDGLVSQLEFRHPPASRGR